MYEEAMDKLRDEAAAAKDEAVRLVGEMMTMALRRDAALAEKVLARGKTLAGAYKAIYEEAKKNRRGCIPPGEALKIVLEYYGATVPDEDISRILFGGAEAPAPLKPKDDMDLDLDALLEG